MRGRTIRLLGAASVAAAATCFALDAALLARLRAQRDADAITAIVQALDGDFERLTVVVTTRPRAAIIGNVPSSGERQRLLDALVPRFGEPEARHIAGAVRVGQ